MNIRAFRETHFKDTELGPLPEEWQVVRLGDLVAKGDIWLKNGFAHGGHNQAKSGVPHLRPFNITNTGEITLAQVKYVPPPTDESSYWILPGDIIFNNTNSEELVGKTAYFGLDGKFVFSNHMTLIRVLSDNLNAYWLSKYFHWLWSQRVFQGLCRRHVNQASIGLERLQQVIISLPPLPEQQAIAHVLRTVQEAKWATERVIAALRDLKKSLMRHLFTYGPVPLGERDAVPLRDTEIGPIPEHWQVVRLGEVVERTEQVDPTRTPEWRFKYVDVSCVNNELLQITDYQICAGKDAPSRARKLIKAGDVIFATVRPYLKRIALIPADLDGQICSTAFCVLRPLPDLIDGDYLFFVVSRDEFVARVAEHQRGSSYPAVTDGDVKRSLIPLPPLPDQREIARILQSVDRRIAAEEAYARALDDLFKSLLHELMSGRLRVVPDFVAQSAVEAKHGLAPTLPTTAETRRG